MRTLAHERERIVFGRKRKETIPETIETVIGPTANFVGHLKSDGGVRLEGVLEGSLETAGNLVAGEKSRIIANITAHNISIAGAVRGNIMANRVEVLSTGQVWGDITVNSFLLDEGGFIQGQVSMRAEGREPPRPVSQTVGADSSRGEEGAS